ncbi:MAG: enoyl-CoA hydratase/isomerase family protein [Candidatus Tectomicrobia bacterium]|uniref:Enoyl-CoA hydratase/isomerase family protein n=1 Tax=Tectimicrobiota bacterium TaxID=2528274 RepID=A0A932MPU6_UNCTE|nr:enoyl-CoA hydratase/isomerase family protein [Candidatus Tectomicrobia bacterium]
MAEDTLLVEKQGGVATVVINRPGQHNAIMRAMWGRIPGIFEELEKDGETRVIVLRGAGEKAFASGQDISEFRETTTPEAARAHSGLLDGVLARIAAIRLPIIAMVHGFAMGGAVGLLAVCDLRYAAEDAVVAVPAARLGIVYPEPLTRLIMDLIGPANAKEMLMTARRYAAEEALRIGFLTRVFPKAELGKQTYETARTIATNAPISVRNAKQMVNLIQKASLPPEEAGRARDLRLEGFNSRDFSEGVDAFLNKRAPVFRGV